VRAGRLRHSVTIQSPEGLRDALGERTTEWVDVAQFIRVGIEPLKSSEVIAAAQAQMQVTHKVVLRYNDLLNGIEMGWRVLFGSRKLIIEGVRNIGERNQSLELMCSEGLRDE
jgi:SPP1 family predicted phage head-tail adaptor